MKLLSDRREVFMKAVLLTVAILSFIAGGFSLIFSALNFHGYYNILDGSNALFDRLQHRMVFFLALGLVLLIAGAVCLIIRHKI